MHDRHHKPIVLLCLSSICMATVASAAEDDWPSGAEWPAWTAASGDAAKGAAAEVRPLSDLEASQWTRWLIPLPKRIQWLGKVAAPASGVNVRLRAGATEVEQTARDELVAIIGKSLAPLGIRGEQRRAASRVRCGTVSGGMSRPLRAGRFAPWTVFD